MFALYVSHAESGEITLFHLDPQRPALVPVQTLAVGGEVMPMALSPDRTRLYAARRSQPREALSFGIDARSGRLQPLGAAALPHSMANIATDRTGRWLFSASYGGDQVAVNAIDPEGIARATQQVEATGRHAHAIHASPDNRFVYAATLGAGVLLRWNFDAERGALAGPATALAPHADASPRHFVFSPDGRFAYLLNELDGVIDVLARDAASGELTPVGSASVLPPGFTGEPWAADLHLAPDGRFLYASERRSSTLSIFAADAASGALSLRGQAATEAQPRGFGLTPDGRFLVAAGQQSHQLSLYAVDAMQGGLTLVDRCATGRGPNWVESIALSI